MSAAGKAENTEAAAAAEPGPPVSWDLGVDITVAIANLITEENSPFFDEADIASVAASCMCVGHPTFTSIAEILYQFLSPRFGDDPGVSEGSSVGELKAVLKVSRRAGANAAGCSDACWKFARAPGHDASRKRDMGCSGIRDPRSGGLQAYMCVAPRSRLDILGSALSGNRESYACN